MTQCGWGDVKIQELCTPLKYCPEGTLNGPQDVKIKASTNPLNSWRKLWWPHLGWGCRTALPSCTLLIYWKTFWGKSPPTFGRFYPLSLLLVNWQCAGEKLRVCLNYIDFTTLQFLNWKHFKLLFSSNCSCLLLVLPCDLPCEGLELGWSGGGGGGGLTVNGMCCTSWITLAVGSP